MRAFKETWRNWLPLAGAVGCFAVAYQDVPPIAVYVLIIVAIGLIFDAATSWWERAGGTGGMKDFKQ